MKRLVCLILCYGCLVGFRAPNGDIVSRGDPADKLLLALGSPAVVSNRSLIPKGNAYIVREVWVYKLNDGVYRFTIEDGIILSDEWNRQ